MVVREIYARLGIKVDKKSVEGAKNTFTELKSQLELLKDAFGVAKGVVDKLIGETVAYAGQVKKTAQITGMTRDQVQELGAAADDAGVEFGTLQAGMIRLSRSGVKDVHAKIWQLVDAFEKVKDPAQRSAMAFKLFGRQGQQLIPFLAKGRKELEESIATNRQFGNIMSEDDLEATLKLKKALKELGDRAEGIRRTIAVPFVKILGKAAVATQEWVDANGELVMDGVKRGVEEVIWVLRSFWRVGTDAVHVVKWLADEFGAGTVAASALAAAILLAGDSTMMLTLKWLAVGAVIAIVAEDFSRYLQGQSSLIGDIRQALDDFWNDWSPEAAAAKIRNLENHPVIMFFNTILWTVTHIQETIDNWKWLFGASPDAQRRAGEMFSAAPNAAVAAINAPATATQAVSGGIAAWGEQKINDWFDRTLGFHTIGGPGTELAGVNPNVPVVVNSKTEITVNASPGMDESAVADKVAQKIDSRREAEIRQARNALVPKAPTK